MKSKIKVKPEIVNPYPFEIIQYPPAYISGIPSIGKIGSWTVLEVFRIEALRRCQTVHRLFKQNVSHWVIFDKYGVTWPTILEGKLTDLIFIKGNFNGETGDGITSLAWKLKDVEQDEFDLLIRLMLKPSTRNLYIEIDLTVPPHRIIQSLLPYLKMQHKDLVIETKCNLREKRDPSWVYHPPFHSRKQSPIRNVQSWLTYLRCYDLHRCSQLSPGQISKYLYGTTRKEDNVDKAIKRVKRLIEYAENNDWPPSKLT